MSPIFRILLIICSILANITIMKKVRESSLQIDDSLFWVVSSFFILIISIFPKLIYIIADKLGVSSPANLVYLLIITILLARTFSMSIKISNLENKIKILAQKMSLGERN